MTDREELMHDAERGRRYRIAGEVLKEFLDGRKEEIIRDMEYCTSLDECTVNEYLYEMRMMRAFRDRMNNYIQLGKIAEEELSYGDEASA